MAVRHQGDTKEFRELSFAEQAESITATINNLQAAIEHHVEHSPRRLETIEKCLAQIERLGQRLRGAYDQKGSRSGSGHALPSVEKMPRFRVGSPRLAEPERAADFAMDVAEESEDAGIR
jgi:hypothetical protein